MEDRHRETGVIDVRVAGDEHDIDRIPPASGHFVRSDWRKRCSVPLVPERQGDATGFAPDGCHQNRPEYDTATQRLYQTRGASPWCKFRPGNAVKRRKRATGRERHIA